MYTAIRRTPRSWEPARKLKPRCFGSFPHDGICLVHRRASRLFGLRVRLVPVRNGFYYRGRATVKLNVYTFLTGTLLRMFDSEQLTYMQMDR